MRAYLLPATSLAALVARGPFVAAQTRAEDFGDPRGPAMVADNSLLPPLPGRSGVPADAPLSGPPHGSAASKAADPNKALAAKPPPEAVRRRMLDTLFQRLRDTPDPEDAKHIAASIERVWLQTSSDTASLLMQRATASVQAGQYPLALSLFDKLVALDPDWAEAWNQRATVRFMTGNTEGAVADINQVIKLEPRHFGALTGMGLILQGEGLDKRALEIFKQALAIYPLAPDIQKLVEKLTLEIEGRDI
jgi:tetratricopeptide (TPR) repeat protein